MNLNRPYFTLLSREFVADAWCIEFGDFDRETVKAELQDYRDHGAKKANLRIVATADATMDSINAAVAALNLAAATVAALA